MLSHTTRKNSASLRSCSELSAMYFSRSLGRLRRLVSTRSTCSCIESTCAGRKPRNPSASRSASVKAVPLLSSGSRNSAMPRGESVGRELGLVWTGTLILFPLRPAILLISIPAFPQLKQKVLIEIKTGQVISDSSHAPNLPTALQSAAMEDHTEQQPIAATQTVARLRPLAG